MLPGEDVPHHLVASLGLPPATSVIRLAGPGAGPFLRKLAEAGALFGAAPADDPYGALRKPIAAAIARAPADLPGAVRDVVARVAPSSARARWGGPEPEEGRAERILRRWLSLEENRRCAPPSADLLLTAWRLLDLFEAASPAGGPPCVIAIDGRTGLDRYTAATLEAWATRHQSERVVAVVAASPRLLPSARAVKLDEISEEGTARLRMTGESDRMLAALVALGRPTTLDEACAVFGFAPDPAQRALDTLVETRAADAWGPWYRVVVGSEGNASDELIVAAHAEIAARLEASANAVEEAIAIERHGRLAGEVSGPLARRRVEAAATRFLELGGFEECARLVEAAAALVPPDAPTDERARRHAAAAFACAFAGRFGAAREALARVRALRDDPVAEAAVDYLDAMLLARRRDDEEEPEPAVDRARLTLEAAVARVADLETPEARIERAWIQIALAGLELKAGHTDAADPHIEAAAAALAGGAHADRPEAARALAGLARVRGRAAIARRNAGAARRAADELEALARAIGAGEDDADAALIRANAALLAGDRAAAALFRAVADLAARHCDARLAAVMAKNAGGIALDGGDAVGALEAYRFALELRRATGSDEEIAAALMNVGLAARAMGDQAAASAAFEEASLRFRAAGRPDFTISLE